MAYYSGRVENIKFLINRDKLFVPGEREDEIVKLVLGNILQGNYGMDVFDSSSYDVELSKTLINLCHYFGDDAVKRFKDIAINRFVICQCLSPNEFSTSFSGDQMAWNLNIPRELDKISHIFIGHEAMHVLSAHKNYDEWRSLFLYTEVISMLYELIQAEDKDSETKRSIINWRLHKLIELYNNSFGTDVLMAFKGDKDGLRYYQMLERMYFLSFYYTILLYAMYMQDPKGVLKLVKGVLMQEITTFEMLRQSGLIGDIRAKEFEDSYRLILK